jgi:hypothetical protein
MKENTLRTSEVLEQAQAIIFSIMTFNSRNAEFETDNIEQDESSNISTFNQLADNQFTNQSAQSNESTSDAAFSHAQQMKIADIVVAALRMNRQNNSSSDVSSVFLSSMIIIFETRLER